MDSFKFCASSLSLRLSVAGEDAATFLQGQFTNDLRRDRKDPATYGLWLDNKGKTLADSFVFGKADGTFEIVSESSEESVLLDRLERYIIADDVEIISKAENRRGWILVGKDVGDWLAGGGVEAPPYGQFFETDGILIFRSRAAAQPAWRLVTENGESFEKWDSKIRAECTEVGNGELAAARILAGVPAVPFELGPDDLPNEGGLEHEAISYTKGCYLGQEVMSRLHNLGRVRRRLFVVRWNGSSERPHTPGALFLGERKVGELRSLVSVGSENVGMAMLQTHGVATGDCLAIEPKTAGEFEVVALAEGRAWS
jgi:folate-binding protein YgfZ